MARLKDNVLCTAVTIGNACGGLLPQKDYMCKGRILYSMLQSICARKPITARCRLLNQSSTMIHESSKHCHRFSFLSTQTPSTFVTAEQVSFC